MQYKSTYLLLLFSIFLSISVVSEERLDFANAEQRDRYQVMLQELRCLVCQNQSLADSSVGLAQDLRQEVYTMILAGKTDDQIIAFMVARYGDFVLYHPPIKTTTLFLWFGPFLLMLIGLLLLFRYIQKRNSQSTATSVSIEDRAKLKIRLAEHIQQDKNA